MKNIIFILCCLMVNVYAYAQRADRYYAIDGSEWLTIKDRNERESLLWKENDLNLDYILVADKLPPTMIDKAFVLFDTLRSSFARLRKINNDFSIFRNNGVREVFFSHNPDLQIDTVRADNHELFYLKSVRDLFNLTLEEYTYWANLIKNTAETEGEGYDYEFLRMRHNGRIQNFQRRYKVCMQELTITRNEIIRIAELEEQKSKNVRL